MTDLAALLQAARDDLRRLPDAYARGLATLNDDDVSIPGWNPGRRRAGKPASQPPPGRDLALRTSLVTATQRLMAAHRALLVWDWPDVTPWEPEGLAYDVVRWQGRRRVTLIQCDSHGRVCWKDPQDATTRLLTADEVQVGARRTAGMLGALEGLSRDSLEDDDLEVIGTALSEVARAKRQLASVWARPPRRCHEADCDDGTGEKRLMGKRRGTTCDACAKAKSRAAKAS